MYKKPSTCLIVWSTLVILVGAALFFHLLDRPLSNLISSILHYSSNQNWFLIYRAAGAGIFIMGCLWLLAILNPSLISRFIAVLLRKKQACDIWLVRMLARLPNPDARPAQTDRWPEFNKTDWLILSFFLIYGLLIFLGTIQDNYPNLLMGGDEGNTASFAAGFDHPALFAGDMLLNSTRNIQVYSTFNVFFMRLLFPFVASYTLSMAILIPIQIFLQLTGFYIFGRILFGKRIWGVALACLLSISIPINLGEGWSLPVGTVARFNFQALLPFVFCMVLVWRTKPARWPWIMAATGILFYMHPVSTPSWAVAIWLSLFLSAPGTWKFWKRVGYMFGMGLIFLAVSMPYIVTYLSNHVQGASANYDLVYSVIVNLFPENLLNVPAAVQVFTGLMLRNGLLPAAILSLAVILILRRTHREPFNIVLIWMFSIGLMAIFVPFIMHSYEQKLRLIPTETEMVRAIRYFIPLMLLLVLWALYEISLHIKSKPLPRALYGAILPVVLLGGTLLTAPMNTLQKAAACLVQGKLICAAPSDYELLIQAVKIDVPESSPVFATFANSSPLGYGMPIRYLALRPLVYAFKDRGLLVYSNDKALTHWYDVYQQMIVIDRMPVDNFKKPEKYLDLARELGAQFIITDDLTDFSILAGTPTQEIYRNEQFSLLKIN